MLRRDKGKVVFSQAFKPPNIFQPKHRGKIIESLGKSISFKGG